MLDYGAIGTTIIGLQAIRREQELSGADAPRRRRPARPAPGAGYRAALARGLRGLADLVEPRRTSSSAGRA
jgi:hypothetical protein